jgi:hypothetical protein
MMKILLADEAQPVISFSPWIEVLQRALPGRSRGHPGKGAGWQTAKPTLMHSRGGRRGMKTSWPAKRSRIFRRIRDRATNRSSPRSGYSTGRMARRWRWWMA